MIRCWSGRRAVGYSRLDSFNCDDPPPGDESPARECSYGGFGLSLEKLNRGVLEVRLPASWQAFVQRHRDSCKKPGATLGGVREER